MAWNEIEEIVAFRAESVSHGLVCALIRSRIDALQITEQVPGFSELAHVLAFHLPGALPFNRWYPQLIASSELSSLLLYKRDAGPQSRGGPQ